MKREHASGPRQWSLLAAVSIQAVVLAVVVLGPRTNPVVVAAGVITVAVLVYGAVMDADGADTDADGGVSETRPSDASDPPVPSADGSTADGGIAAPPRGSLLSDAPVGHPEVGPGERPPVAPPRTRADGGTASQSAGVTVDSEESIGTLLDDDLRSQFDADLHPGDHDGLESEIDALLKAVESRMSRADFYAEQVSTSATQVSGATESLKDTSEEVTEAVSHIVDDLVAQHERVEDISEEVNRMSAAIQQIASSTERVAGMATDTEEASRKGSEALETARSTMQSTDETTAELVATGEALEKRMDEIGDIVEFIDDIADQTNMLALNASIEAARADDSGNGFEVVADEVKSLAEETKDATGEIDDLVTSIQEETTTVVEEMHTIRDQVRESVAALEAAYESLTEIRTHAEETRTGTGEMSDATDTHAKSVQEIAASATEVADLSESTRSDAEDVAAIAEEQSLALGEVYVNSRELSMQADHLTRLFGDDA